MPIIAQEGLNAKWNETLFSRGKKRLFTACFHEIFRMDFNDLRNLIEKIKLSLKLLCTRKQAVKKHCHAIKVAEQCFKPYCFLYKTLFILFQKQKTLIFRASAIPSARRCPQG